MSNDAGTVDLEPPVVVFTVRDPRTAIAEPPGMRITLTAIQDEYSRCTGDSRVVIRERPDEGRKSHICDIVVKCPEWVHEPLIEAADIAAAIYWSYWRGQRRRGRL